MRKTWFSFIILLVVMAGTGYSQNWTYITNTGTTFILYGMSFPPGQSTIGYACGMQYTYDADGVIVKTTDGGNNWTQIWPVSGTIDGLQGIWFTSDLVGFACGWNNYFIKTTDGGATWTPITVGADVWYYRDVEFRDANNGLAVGVMNIEGAQAAFITSNGGTSWTPAMSGLAVNDVMGISYASQNIVYAAGTSANIYKSTDGGHNWTVSSTLSAMLLGIDFVNTTFAVVGGEEKIFATNNGGTSWTTYTTGYENFYGALALADGTGYCGGTDENIYKTTDFGQNWTMDYNGTGSSTLYRIRQTADGTIFACGSQGKIMKMIPPLIADFTSSTTTVCTGGTVNFFDISSGAITSWSWTFEGGTPSTSTLENPVVVYNTAGTFDVQLTVTSGSNNSTELKTDYITVYGSLATPNTPTGPSEVCGTYSYQYSTQPVQYAESYDWEVTPSAAGTFTGNDVAVIFTASGNWEGAFAIKVRAVNVCGDGPWSPDLSGTVNHNPVVFDLLGEGAWCEGSDGAEITLSDSETGVSYELFKDNLTTGVILGGTGEPVSFGFFQETGLYTATGFTSSCSENMVGQIYVHMEPVPGQAAMPEGPGSSCNDEVSDYLTEGAEDADDYIWTLEPAGAGTLVPGGDACYITWNGDFEGTAYLSVTGENVCGTGEPSEALAITVNPVPVPTVTGPGLVCDEEEADYSTAQVAGSVYSWEVTGGEIVTGSGTAQVTVLWGAPGPGSVTVTETTAAECQATSETLFVTIDDCTYIGEGNENEAFIYPNPFTDHLLITGCKDSSIEIYNLLGVIVIKHKIEDNFKMINTSDLHQGIYLVRIIQAEKMSDFQLIKR